MAQYQDGAQGQPIQYKLDLEGNNCNDCVDGSVGPCPDPPLQHEPLFGRKADKGTGMNKVRTHTFRGVKYFIGVDDPYICWCDRPKSPDRAEYPAIRMPNGLDCGDGRKARADLIVLLHECLHASEWSTSEKAVDRTAEDIGKLLWRLGFRRVE